MNILVKALFIASLGLSLHAMEQQVELSAILQSVREIIAGNTIEEALKKAYEVMNEEHERRTKEIRNSFQGSIGPRLNQEDENLKTEKEQLRELLGKQYGSDALDQAFKDCMLNVRDKYDLLKAILFAGVDVEMELTPGNNAILLAAEAGDERTLKLLTDAGADDSTILYLMLHV